MKGKTDWFILLIIGVILVLLLGKGILFAAINPDTGHKYAIVDLWGWIKCEPIGYGTYTTSMSFSGASWLNWFPSVDQRVSCGDFLFTSKCNMKVTVEKHDLAYAVLYAHCFPDTRACTDWVTLDLAFPFGGAPGVLEKSLPTIPYGDWYIVRHRGIQSGYITVSGDKYGLKAYPLTSEVKTINDENCNLEGLDLTEKVKICKSGRCEFPRNTLTWEAPNDVVSYASGFTIGLSDLNFRYDKVSSKRVYCEMTGKGNASLYALDTYTALSGDIYDYVDKSKTPIREEQCCPGIITNCGDDFKIHALPPEQYGTGAGTGIPQNITCNIVSQCTGGGQWFQDSTNPTKSVRATGCINNVCSYEYKDNVWKNCTTWETLYINPVTGESYCVTQIGGQQISTVKNLTEEAQRAGKPPEVTQIPLWLIAIIIILILVIIFMGRGRGGVGGAPTVIVTR